MATTMFLMNPSWHLSSESGGKLHSVHAQSLEKGERKVMSRVFIGASLSEPHTSVTALCMRVYAWTDHLPQILNQCIQIFHND